MARPLRLDIPGALYHVIARGNRRQTIFQDVVDYRRYVDLLAHYQQRHGFTLYAYALMPNHLHLLLSPGRLPLSKTMQGLQQTYTRHFNKRHRVTGHCFQGRYKAILCQSDAYLLELVRYLHLNPVRAGLTHAPDKYQWSSHRLYLDGRNDSGVTVESVLGQFSSVRGRAVAAYRTFVQAGLPADHREDLYAVVAGQLLGDERFVERMERKARQVPPRPPVDVSLQVIARHVARALNVREDQIHTRGRARGYAMARTMVAYLAREEAGVSLKAVAAFFTRDEATLSIALRRLEAQMGTNPQLAGQVSHLSRLIRRGATRSRRKQIIKA